MGTSQRESTSKKGCLSKRTLLEKILFAFLIITLICLAGLAIALAVKNMKDKDVLCVTPECIKIVHDMQTSTDSGVDPCQDFYNYTCGQWINNTIFMDGVTTRFSKLNDDMDLKLKVLLEGDDDVTDHFQKARHFFKACMNNSVRETESLEGFLDDIHSFGGYPVLSGNNWEDHNFNYLTTLRHMTHKGTIQGLFLSVEIELDYKNNSRQLITLSQTQFGLPYKDYFKVDYIVEGYLNLAAKEAFYLCQQSPAACPGRTLEIIKEELRHAVEIEKALADMAVPEQELSRLDNVYNVMEIGDLQDKAPGINWLALIQIFFPEVGEDELVMVKLPEFMENFSIYIRNQLRSTEGSRNLANYLMYRHTMDAALHLTKEIRNMDNDFKNSFFMNNEPPKDWKSCVKFARKAFSFSLAAMYAKEHFPKRRKEAMDEMMETIRSELKEILQETTWMDKETKEKAISKVDKIHILAAYPENLLDQANVNRWYGNLDVGDNHFENYKKTNIFTQQKYWDAFKLPVDRTSWRYVPGSLLDVNAFYYPVNNSIIVPLGITQEWFFHEDNPKYVNYGRTGFVVAHELGHAFDTLGSEFDEQGNWRKWWKNSTRMEFERSSKCMVDMFNEYYVPEAERTINGTLTLGENTADDLALAESYRAYVKAHEHEPDNPLPGVSLTSKQLFWVNTAMVWCEKQHPEMYKVLLRADGHSPSRYRILSTMSNNADFISDFECPHGSNMNKKSKKCHVWGV